MVDENGAAVILKNNAPRYILIDYSKFQQDTIADDATVEEAANNILSKHLKAFWSWQNETPKQAYFSDFVVSTFLYNYFFIVSYSF